MAQHRVILDTDIGDDIDDAFALGLLLRCPEIELTAVTTVFGNNWRRADLAASLLRATGREAPIACGCWGTITAGLGDEAKLPQVERLTYRAAEERWPWPDMSVVMQHFEVHSADGGGVLLTIGPMTTLAMSLVGNPRVKERPRLIAMCGEFQREGFIEHNIRCDVESAAICFGSGLKIDVIPWSIGPAVKLTEADVRRLEGSSDPVVKLLVEWLEQFWKHVPGKTNMYDPMTVVALLRPELFEWRRGRVTVELRDEERYGLTRFEADEAGPHRVAFPGSGGGGEGVYDGAAVRGSGRIAIGAPHVIPRVCEFFGFDPRYFAGIVAFWSLFSKNSPSPSGATRSVAKSRDLGRQ